MSAHPIVIPPKPGAWVEKALCTEVDPEIWFPDKGGRGTNRLAKTICAACPVIGECRLYALTNRMEHGVWGGLDAHQRLQVLQGKAKPLPTVPVKQPTIPVLHLLAKRKPAQPSPLPPAAPVRPPRSEPEHGTCQGHSWHMRNRDKPCEPCRLAKNAYVRAHNKAKRERTNA